jgi:hypothetical protein
MATKAERFRAESQRTKHKAPKARKTRKIIDPLHTDTRNLTKRVGKREGPVLEDSMSGRPSRKSTRTSSHHGRSDTKLMRTAQLRALSPKSTAARARAARKK